MATESSAIEGDRLAARSTGVRIVSAVQLALLAIYLIGSFGVLLSAVAHTGDFGALFDPGLERLGDPKDSLPPVGPDSVWNPLAWIFELSRVAAFFVFPLAIGALVLGALGLISARAAGDRRAFTRLVAGTTAWAAVGVLACTPYGLHMLSWLLD